MANSDSTLIDFSRKARLGPSPSLVEVVEAIRAIPYGRPTIRSAAGVVSEWLGTCSTKHMLLVEYVAQRWPELGISLVHRVYRLTSDAAHSAFGNDVARCVPDDGLIDVHTFANLWLDGQPTWVDVTFPGDLWDGRSHMTLACAAGRDYNASVDPWKLKDELVEEHCDPLIRERFIAALTSYHSREQNDSRIP